MLNKQIIFARVFLVGLLLGSVACPPVFASPRALNPNPPSTPTRLVFIHHSTGGYWLADEHGQLGIALRDNNYYVSATNYGWGPSGIGDRTDMGNWWEWFRGPSAATFLAALYSEAGQNLGGFGAYSRLATAPGGANEIVLFKSCYPNSALQGAQSDPVPAIGANPLRGNDAYSTYHTFANAKGIYMDLLNYFAAHQEKLFVVITAPPLVQDATNASEAANARAFNAWLSSDWLDGYAYHNVFVFDFYNVLTTNGGSTSVNDLGALTGNHHRYASGVIQHISNQGINYSAYGSSSGDSHPTPAGDLKATDEFVPLLNIAYHCWRGDGACPTDSPPSPIHLPVVLRSW